MSLARERDLILEADWLQSGAFWVHQASDPSGIWMKGELAIANTSLQRLVNEEPSFASALDNLCQVAQSTGDTAVLHLSGERGEYCLQAHPQQANDSANCVSLVVRASLHTLPKPASETVLCFRQAIESLFDAIFILDIAQGEDQAVQLVITECNQQAAKFLGLHQRDLLGKDLATVLHGAWGEDIVERYQDVFRSQQPLEEEFSLVGPTCTIWVRQRVVPCANGVAVTLQDVSRERSLALQMEEHRRVLDNALDGILTADPLGRIDFINSTFAGMLERPAESLLGQTWDCIAQPDERPKLDDLLRQTSTHRRGEIEVRGERPDGMVIFMSLVILPRFREGKPYGHYVFAIDNTDQRTHATQLEMQMRLLADARDQLTARSQELEVANVRLRDLATTDGLTGLRNHRYFRERLAAEVARCNRYQLNLSILMVDVDYFKQFNDTHGHPAGDEVLRDLASILRSKVRTTDLVARYGGEEFAVIMPQTDAAAARLLGERLRIAVEMWRWKWSTTQLTISAGGASYQPGITSAEDLLQQADDALYLAKDLGRNRVCFANTLSEETAE